MSLYEEERQSDALERIAFALETLVELSNPRGNYGTYRDGSTIHPYSHTVLPLGVTVSSGVSSGTLTGVETVTVS